MIDMIEARIIARQIAEHLYGKIIDSAEMIERKKGSMRDQHLIPIKPEKFRTILAGAKITEAYSKYRHVIIETDGDMGINIWDVYGKILFIEAGAKIPGNPPISLCFTDGSRLIVLPGVWGEMRIKPREELRAFRDSIDPEILDISSDAFTVEALTSFLNFEIFQKNHIKEVLTRYYKPGVMSMMGSLCQEVLYRAKIHPKHKIRSLRGEEIAALHRAMKEVTHDAIAAGGRASERDLFDQPGGFEATVSKAHEGQPCPVCCTAIQGIKIGGAGTFYICPGCQVN